MFDRSSVCPGPPTGTVPLSSRSPSPNRVSWIPGGMNPDAGIANEHAVSPIKGLMIYISTVSTNEIIYYSLIIKRQYNRCEE